MCAYQKTAPSISANFLPEMKFWQSIQRETHIPWQWAENKIERRPMMLVSAQNKKGKRVSLVLQNAETIRLTTPDGKPASVTRLQKGDMVLAFFGESTGRHFGEAIQETIREK
jgi:3-dehydroquinate synthase class II